MNDQPLIERLDFILPAIRAAGDLTLRYFRQAGVTVERKSDASPVTIADREAEKLLREAIAAEFPDDAVLGEELGERPGTSGYRWILDPIDGTKSFISGVPLYSTLVGLEKSGQTLLGAILIPALNECVYAARGHGAWYVRGNEPAERTRVSSTGNLAESLFLTSEVKTFDENNRRMAFDQLQKASRLTRTWGDGYGYLLIATGRADLMVDAKMNVWDCAALQPIIEEAGGKFTDWRGEATIYGGDAVASNGLVHHEALKLMSECC
jgi:histidinol phosphatase-like enzyme (inositol monophosphatase family)